MLLCWFSCNMNAQYVQGVCVSEKTGINLHHSEVKMPTSVVEAKVRILSHTRGASEQIHGDILLKSIQQPQTNSH